MADWQAHEARSQELADSVRRYLVAAHTGGIAVTFALAGSLASNHVHPRWAFAPVGTFTIGLILVGISMLLAQHREMKRRDARKAGDTDPSFGRLWWSWVWNWMSLATFALGVTVGLYCLSAISVGST